MIDNLFPDLSKEESKQGQQALRRGNDVRAVVELLANIPAELIRLSAAQAALFLANTFALRNEWEDRNPNNNQVVVRPIGRAAHTSLFEIRRLLAGCPDEAPAALTTGLEFIADDAFRATLRTDLSSANAALMNHEYKAATVIAGSVVEALLLWALEQHGVAGSGSSGGRRTRPLNEWTLGSLISAAHDADLITDDTRKQTELAQNYRNLIHPGRQARLGEKCDRGTALAALSAAERVAVELERRFPRAKR